MIAGIFFNKPKNLLQAVMTGQTSHVKKYIESGEDVNQADADGRPVLFYAVKPVRKKIIYLLAEAGADIDKKIDPNNKTILMYAAEFGDTDAVRILADLGADVNLKEATDEKTALLLACWEGHEEIVRILLEKGADVNHRKKGDKTSLMYAAHSGNEKIVRMILDKGVDVNFRNVEGQNALMYCSAKEERINAMKAIIEHGADIDLKDNEGKTVLMWTAYYGCLNMATLLIKSGANVNATNNDGQTAMIYAENAEDNSDEMQELLKAKGAKDMPTTFGYKVQIECSECGQSVVINGPLEKVQCKSCQSMLELTNEFWESFFDSASDLGGTVTVFGGDKLKIKYRITEPRCIKCGEELAIQNVTEGSDTPITCKKCDTKNNCFPVPAWIRNFKVRDQVPVQVFGGERQGEDDIESRESLKPVAIRCISCNAALSITVDTPRNATCKFCNTLQYLPDPLWRSLHPQKKMKEWYILFKAVDQ
jgi:ankyrin repeat protein